MAERFIVQKSGKDGWSIGFYDAEGLWWPVEDRPKYVEASKLARLWNEKIDHTRKAKNGDSPN